MDWSVIVATCCLCEEDELEIGQIQTEILFFYSFFFPLDYFDLWINNLEDTKSLYM